MKLIYLITLILWAFGLVNLFEPFNGITFYLASIIFYGLLIAHLIECIVYLIKFLFKAFSRSDMIRSRCSIPKEICHAFGLIGERCLSVGLINQLIHSWIRSNLYEKRYLSSFPGV